MAWQSICFIRDTQSAEGVHTGEQSSSLTVKILKLWKNALESFRTCSSAQHYCRSCLAADRQFIWPGKTRARDDKQRRPRQSSSEAADDSSQQWTQSGMITEMPLLVFLNPLLCPIGYMRSKHTAFYSILNEFFYRPGYQPRNLKLEWVRSSFTINIMLIMLTVDVVKVWVLKISLEMSAQHYNAKKSCTDVHWRLFTLCDSGWS